MKKSKLHSNTCISSSALNLKKPQKLILWWRHRL